MKKIVVLLLLLFLHSNLFSQTNYEQGYFIDNLNKRVTCLIKNLDWKNNPTSFAYKLSEDGSLNKGAISNIKEFGITGKVKFVRAKVDLDISSNEPGKLDSDRRPKFISETLFLSVLVEGKATLYSYQKGDLSRFFYQIDDSIINPLVHKLFLFEGNRIATNLDYKQKLLNHLKCNDIQADTIKDTAYKANSLANLFYRYNICIDGKANRFTNHAKRDLFNLSIRAGVRSNMFKVEQPNSNKALDFGSTWSYRVGLELELILPFSNNKWAIIAEPTIQSFKTSNKTTNLGAPNDITTYQVKLDFSSVELPLGLRHYSFLNDDFRLFVSAVYVMDMAFDSKMDYEVLSDIELFKQGTFGLGVGLVFKERFNFEVRYDFNRDNLWNNSVYASDYSSLSFILGYRIL